ncbi:MAG: hypothetical protein WCO23_03945 [bacterium]
MNLISRASAGAIDFFNGANTITAKTSGTVDDIFTKIDSIVTVVIGLVGVIIFAYVIYGGFLYLTSQGEPAQTKKAQQIILFAIIGAVILGLAYAISTLIVNFVNNGKLT